MTRSLGSCAPVHRGRLRNLQWVEPRPVAHDQQGDFFNVKLLSDSEKQNRGILCWVLFLLCATVPARAEKAPLSVEALQQEASAIVVATIERIRVQTEEAEFGKAFGNWDWGIYLTLRTEAVVKGLEGEDLNSSRLEVRCFRIKSRRNMFGYLAPSGHSPIPETGTRIKVYLERRKKGWAVLLPNGIVPLSAAGEPLGQSVPDAQRIAGLRSLMYTWLLPLEAWPPLLISGAIAVLCVRWLRRRNVSKSATQSHRASATKRANT